MTEEQLKMVEEMGYLLIDPRLVAINIEWGEEEFMACLRTPGTRIRNAYYKGYLRQIMDLRAAMVKASNNGSNPAQMELAKLLKETSQLIKHG